MSPWAAALAALVLGGAELGSAGHAALVRHAVCAEHGEAVHAAAYGQTVAIAVSSVDAVSPAPPAVAFVDEHEHCKILVGASRIVPPDRRASASLSCEGGVRIARNRVLVSFAVPLFRLAPKNSPPVSG